MEINLLKEYYIMLQVHSGKQRLDTSGQQIRPLGTCFP